MVTANSLDPTNVPPNVPERVEPLVPDLYHES
jgi:hypothetical protein